MKKKGTDYRINLFALLLIASLLLSACGSGGAVATGSDGTIIWLDQPMTNYMLPIAPFTLIAHAGHPGAGISQVNFLVNGVSIGTVLADTSLEFLRSEITWNPSGPGLYRIQAQATSPGGVTDSHISYICVVAGVSAPQPWSGDCASTTGIPFTINFNLDPAPVYFGNCPENILQFQAKITGDTSSITGVQASWNFTNLDGSAPSVISGESGLAMTMQSAGTYTYERDFSTAARDFGLTADSYLLNASIWAIDSSGNRLNTQTIGPVQFLNCSGTPTVSVTSTTPTETPIAPTTTPLLASRTPAGPTRTPIVITPTITLAPCANGVIDAAVTDGSTWNASWAPFVTLCIGSSCQNPNASGTAEWSLPAGSYTLTGSSSAYGVSPSSIPITLACGDKSVNNFMLVIP